MSSKREGKNMYPRHLYPARVPQAQRPVASLNPHGIQTVRIMPIDDPEEAALWDQAVAAQKKH
jgi:hypothetical protein